MSRVEILDQEVYNPITKRNVTVRYALRLTKTHPAYKAAVALVNRGRKPKKKVEEPKTKSSTEKVSELKVDPKMVDVVTKHIRSRRPDSIVKLKAYGDKYLKGVSPIDIAATYLSVVWDPSKGDTIVELNVYEDPDYDRRLAIEIRLSNGTSINRYIRTSQKTGDNIIKNDYFEVGKDVPKGGGLARRMLQETIKIADAIGAVAVMFEAGLSAGGYVWAKYGAIPHPRARIHMYESILSKVKDLPQYVAKMIVNKRENLEYYEDLLGKYGNDDSTSREYYSKLVERQRKQLIEAEKSLDLVLKNKEQIEVLKKLIQREMQPILDQYLTDNGYLSVPYDVQYKVGRQLSPELLNYIAHTPIGKFLLLDTGWEGYFNMRKGSLGRKMLEKEVF